MGSRRPAAYRSTRRQKADARSIGDIAADLTVRRAMASRGPLGSRAISTSKSSESFRLSFVVGPLDEESNRFGVSV